MSIYATVLSIEDVRQTAEEMKKAGINFGIIAGDGEVEDFNELEDEMLDAPIVYEGSHVLPSDDDRRGGSVNVAYIPDHITRDGRDDAPEGSLKDWLRLGVHNEASHEQYEGKPYIAEGMAAVILTRPQVERLRNTLTEWLERERNSGEHRKSL